MELGPILRPGILSLVLPAAICGCSVFNAPNRELIPPSDGGAVDAQVDAETEGGTPDGGLPIEVCDDPTGKDEDGDGFANCDDFECAALPVCCGGSTGSTSFLETWSGSIGDHWNPVPSTDTTYPITNEASEELDSFGAGSAAVAKQCVPLRVGAEVRVDFRPTGEGSGSDYASILLTGSEDAATFDRLIEDLRVVAQGNSLFVTSGGIAVGSSVGIAAGAKTSVAIVVTPSLDTAGNGILVARVSAQTKGKSHVLVEAYPFLAQDDLVAAGACGAVPGLYLGVVGVGEGMALGRIEVAPLECVNPSQFTAYPDKFAETPIEGSSLSSEAWGGGGVGSPAILVSSGESPTWDIFFDAPDAPREQDQYRDLPFSLGHARWESSTPAWDTRATAKCSRAMVSVREPSLFGALTAYARKGPPGEPQGIDVTSSKAEELEESFGPRTIITLPATDTDDCDEVRDPSLTLAPEGENHWLFFSCMKNGEPPHIRRATLPKSPTTFGGGETTVVLRADAVGAYGSGGVWAPEVLREEGTHGVVYRLWFLAEERTDRRVTVGLAQWSEGSESAIFQEFPGNPVLRGASLEGAECTGECEITGLAVARQSAAGLRFLLARTVKGNSEVEYEFVPLAQTWKAPE